MNLRHEMHKIPPVATMLHWAIERVLRPDGWELHSLRGGWNSFVLEKDGDKRQFHFRWWASRPNNVMVYDRYYNGKKIADLATENDVIRFAIAVKNGRKLR